MLSYILGTRANCIQMFGVCLTCYIDSILRNLWAFEAFDAFEQVFWDVLSLDGKDDEIFRNLLIFLQKRVMENERVTFNEERVKKSRQQKKIIEILRREQEQLQEELNSLLVGPHAKRESELEQEMKRLEAEIESHTQLLDAEKGNLWELDGHIRKLQKEIDRLRSNQITDHRYNEKICKMQKDVVKLENRLEVAHKRAGAVMAENAELRQMIDHMLQERALFNDVWAKMVTQLNQGKKHMMDLIDQSTAAYDQRDELCNKLQLLKDRSQADKMAHIQEMRELQRKLDHDAKLHQFLGIKGQHRVNTELDMREANKKRQLQEQLENQLEEYNTILQRIRVSGTLFTAFLKISPARPEVITDYPTYL